MLVAEQDRVEDFVAKLWTNPAIRSATLSRKENQILTFLKDNRKQLETAFSRPDFFPGKSFDDVARMVLSVLTETILNNVTPRVDHALDKIYGSGVMEAFNQEGGLSIERAKFREFILSNMRAKALRDPYILAVETVSAGLYDRYIPIILSRRKVIYNEIIRRDRLMVDNALIPAVLNLSTLLRPLFWYGFSRFAGQGQIVTLAGVQRDLKVFDASLKDLKTHLVEALGTIPERFYKAGLESCLDPTEREVGGAGRLITIMNGRILDYDPNQKADRGAESPDKSWFNINRRTAKFHGYDLRFLEELYQIAGEEGW